MVLEVATPCRHSLQNAELRSTRQSAAVREIRTHITGHVTGVHFHLLVVVIPDGRAPRGM